MKNLLLALLNLILSIGVTILRGYVLVVMWGWFVLTQFAQAPHLSIVVAIGLSILWGLFTMRDLPYTEYKATQKISADERATYNLIQTSIGYVAVMFSWLVGYIVHCFM